MANTLVALGAEDDFVSSAEARFNALPSIAGFNRGMAIADLPPPVALRLADQFEVQFTSPRQHYVFGVSDLPQKSLERTLELRWDDAKRLGRRVAHQFLGPVNTGPHPAPRLQHRPATPPARSTMSRRHSPRPRQGWRPSPAAPDPVRGALDGALNDAPHPGVFYE